MSEHFSKRVYLRLNTFWKSQLQTQLRAICANLPTQLILKKKVLGITSTLGQNTWVEGGRKSGGAVFEVDSSKKSVQFYLDPNMKKCSVISRPSLYWSTVILIQI